MVEWPRTVNPVLKKRNRFESYHLHQICSVFPVAGCNPVDLLSRVAVKWFDSITLHQVMVLSYSGYYTGLSSRISGFDSPQDRQISRVTQRQSNRLISDKSTFRNCPWLPNIPHYKFDSCSGNQVPL
jgi:hypothetical protein